MESHKEDHPCEPRACERSASGCLTGTNSPPHTFAAGRSSFLSPCPPLRLIPLSWSDPAAGSSPFSPSLASLWWGEGSKRKVQERYPLVIFVHSAQWLKYLSFILQQCKERALGEQTIIPLTSAVASTAVTQLETSMKYQCATCFSSGNNSVRCWQFIFFF